MAFGSVKIEREIVQVVMELRQEERCAQPDLYLLVSIDGDHLAVSWR